MEEQHAGDDSWGQLNRTEWHGLGLTDPIKKVEVSGLKPHIALHSEILGQMAVAPGFFKGQRSGQTTY